MSARGAPQRRRPLLGVAAGLSWAGLSAALYAAGHRPSGPSPFGAHHYLVQAILLPAIVPGLAEIYAQVSLRIAGSRAGPGSEEPAAGAGPSASVEIGAGAGPALAQIFAGALLVAFVLPELGVYAAFGFDALAGASLVTAPLTAVAIVALGTRALRRAGVGWGRAALAALGGLLAQAVVGGLVLR